jgi:hypothetical protein
MLIKYIIIIFALFAVTRASVRLKDKSITKGEYILWIFFWLLVIAGTLIPKNLDHIAQFVGVERGADLAVYLSIVVIFYILFKVLVHLEKIDKEITAIVRKIALSNKENNNEKSSHNND